MCRSVSYTSTICVGRDEGPFPTFKEALKDFIHRLKTDPAAQATQILETACWITRNHPETPIPIGFFDARDFGYKTGILTGEDASFNDDAQEPDPNMLRNLFIACKDGNGDAQSFIIAIT